MSKKHDGKRKPMDPARAKIHAAYHNIRTVGDLQFFGDQMYRKGVRDATARATNDRVLILLWVLHDKFRWNSKARMEKLLKESNELTDAVNQRIITMQEIANELEKECQLKITR